VCSLKAKLCEARDIVPEIRTVHEGVVKVLVDSNGTQYGVTEAKEGIYDVEVHTLAIVKERIDRVYPDSKQMISVARDKTVKIDDLIEYVYLYKERRDFDGIALALDSLKKLPFYSNVYRSVIAPELTQRAKIQLIHRKDLVREFLIQCAVNKQVRLDYAQLWQVFYNKGYHIKDGMLHKLYYQPPELYCYDGLSSSPRPEYYCVVLSTFDHPMRTHFVYRGAFLVYYDHYKWVYNEGIQSLQVLEVSQ